MILTLRNSIKAAEYQKKWHESHKDYVREQQILHKEQRKKNRSLHKDTNNKNCRKYYKLHLLPKIKRDKAIRALLKGEIYQLLGSKCVKCGYVGLALQIDHVNDNGQEERRTTAIGHTSGTASYMRFILKKIRAGSKDYQLLCANCNWEKEIERRIKKAVEVEKEKKLVYGAGAAAGAGISPLSTPSKTIAAFPTTNPKTFDAIAIGVFGVTTSAKAATPL